MRESIILWLFVLAASIIENQYFGWNNFPQSDAELIADLFLLILMAIVYHTTKQGE